MPRADNCQTMTKFAHYLPKPDLHSVNAHTKFGENPLIFTQVIVRKWTDGYTTDGRTGGRSFVWTFIGYYSVSFSAQNTKQDPKIPNNCLKCIGYFFDTNGINGKYSIYVYPIYAHSCANKGRRTDTRTHT